MKLLEIIAGLVARSSDVSRLCPAIVADRDAGAIPAFEAGMASVA